MNICNTDMINSINSMFFMIQQHLVYMYYVFWRRTHISKYFFTECYVGNRNGNENSNGNESGSGNGKSCVRTNVESKQSSTEKIKATPCCWLHSTQKVKLDIKCTYPTVSH